MALDLYAKLKDEPPGFQQDVCEKFSSLLLTLECCTKWHHDRIFEKYLPFLNKEVSEIIIHDDNELDDLEDAQFLIDEILMDDSLNVIYGPSNDAKTVAAMGMCFSAITGAPWMGRDVHRTGPAFYINSEAFNETKDRKNAWKDELGLNGQRTEFYGIDAELDLAGAGTRDVDRLIESIRAKQAEKRIESVRPGIIVIDTLARNFGNEDENATQSMNRFVRHCDRIRKEFRCPVIVIHHTGINDKRERGNRALRSACYTMIEVKRVKKGQDLISFSCIKMRGAPFFKPISMRLTVLPHIGKKGSVVLRKGDGGDQAVVGKAISIGLTLKQRQGLEVLYGYGAEGVAHEILKSKVTSTFFQWEREKFFSEGLVDKHSNGKHFLTESGCLAIDKPPFGMKMGS